MPTFNIYFTFDNILITFLVIISISIISSVLTAHNSRSQGLRWFKYLFSFLLDVF